MIRRRNKSAKQGLCHSQETEANIQSVMRAGVPVHAQCWKPVTEQTADVVTWLGISVCPYLTVQSYSQIHARAASFIGTRKWNPQR